MTLSPTDRTALRDMYTLAREVKDFVAGRTFDEYLKNPLLRGAVERRVQGIGDAAARVSPRLRAEHPDVPWGRIISQRHVLSQEKQSLKHELIWRVATDHVLRLIEYLEPVIRETPRP